MSSTPPIPDALRTGEPALLALVARFSPGYGSAISCGPGWHPLLERLDATLALIDPHYTIQQVKEKFGTLRFYADPSGLTATRPGHPGLPDCCARWWAQQRPLPGDANEPLHLSAELTGRYTSTHQISQAHQETITERAELLAAFQDAIRQAEQTSGRLCERTGGPGVLTGERRLQTLDPVAFPAAQLRSGAGSYDPEEDFPLTGCGQDTDRLRALARQRGVDLAHYVNIIDRLQQALLSAPAQATTGQQ